MGLKHTRRYRRYPLELRVELARGTGVTRNVCAGGAYFLTDQPLAPGAPIDFTLVLEGLSPQAPWRVRCKGTVLRVEPQAAKVGVAATIESCRISPHI